MIFAIAAALLLQTDPRIESVERLTGDLRRPYLLAPLAVTVSSAAGFEGDVVALSEFGFSYAVRIRVAAGGRERVVLPAIEPVQVSAGAALHAIRKEPVQADWLVGVDESLPYTPQVPSSVHRVRLASKDIETLVARGWAEAFDLILSPRAGGGIPAVAAPTAEEADRALAALVQAPPRPRLELVEPSIWALRPERSGGSGKKEAGVFFATVYAFAGFVAVVLAGRRGGRWTAAALGGVAAAGLLAYVLLFPRGQVWVAGAACVTAASDGGAEEWAVWFAGSGADRTVRLGFPRGVKPALVSLDEVREPFTIRVEEGGRCAVEGLRLGAGRAWAFVSGGPATWDPGAPLHGAYRQRDGRLRFLGDLKTGAMPDPPSGPEDPPPPSPEFEVFRRFRDGPCLFGWLEREETAATEVRSDELAGPARRRPRFFVRKLP